MPANDLTYTARWTINSYTLTFDANGGTFGNEYALPEGGVMNDDRTAFTITAEYGKAIPVVSLQNITKTNLLGT